MAARLPRHGAHGALVAAVNDADQLLLLLLEEGEAVDAHAPVGAARRHERQVRVRRRLPRAAGRRRRQRRDEAQLLLAMLLLLHSSSFSFFFFGCFADVSGFSLAVL